MRVSKAWFILFSFAWQLNLYNPKMKQSPSEMCLCLWSLFQYCPDVSKQQEESLLDTAVCMYMRENPSTLLLLVILQLFFIIKYSPNQNITTSKPKWWNTWKRKLPTAINWLLLTPPSIATGWCSSPQDSSSPVPHAPSCHPQILLLASLFNQSFTFPPCPPTSPHWQPSFP